MAPEAGVITPSRPHKTPRNDIMAQGTRDAETAIFLGFHGDFGGFREEPREFRGIADLLAVSTCSKIAYVFLAVGFTPAKWWRYIAGAKGNPSEVTDGQQHLAPSASKVRTVWQLILTPAVLAVNCGSPGPTFRSTSTKAPATGAKKSCAASNTLARSPTSPRAWLPWSSTWPRKMTWRRAASPGGLS
jgi:hypothetical protein